MSAKFTVKSKFALMMRKASDLIEGEHVLVRRLSSRVVWSLASVMALVIGLGYIKIFKEQPAGPPRDLLLEVFNAFTIGLASGFVAFRIVWFATRLRPARAIPLAALAGTILFVGGNLLFDASMRLKADIATAEVRFVALGRLAKLVRPEPRISDVKAAVTDASDYVRAFRDPDRMSELHAEHDRMLRDVEDRLTPRAD